MALSNGYTYMLSIAQFLNSLAKNIDVDLLCLDTEEQFTRYLKDTLGLTLNPRLKVIKISNKKFGIKSNRIFFRRNVLRYLKSLNAHDKKIIYTRDLKQMNGLLKYKGKSFNTKFIFETHQILSQNLCKKSKYKDAKTIRHLENSVFCKVDSLICITKTLSNEIKKSFSSCTKQHLILPVGFNKEFITSNKEDTKYDLIYTGSFVSWKGVDILLKSIKIITKNRKINAVLIGANDAEYLHYSKQITQLGIDNSVTIIKKIKHKDVLSFLCQSNIGVLPNIYEDDSLLFTSPLKLYEYLGVGLKIVCSRLPSIESSVDSELIYWAISEDENSLAEQIILALNDHSFDPKKSKEYSKSFTWEKRAYNLIEHINNTVR